MRFSDNRTGSQADRINRNFLTGGQASAWSGRAQPVHCRLLIDEAGSGPWNMAVDEAILESAIANPQAGPTVRWYRWSAPTLSLGYFQSSVDRPVPFANIDCVRRITGGGAILHDRELTYSLVLPADCWPCATALEIVEDFHQTMSDILNQHLPVALAGEAESGPEPFLCFERRAKVDVVANGRKLIGSAQRNRHRTLLQHGSILLEASPLASHIGGLNELGILISESSFIEAVLAALSSRWQFEFAAGALTPFEMSRAQELAKDRYGAQSWLQQR